MNQKVVIYTTTYCSYCHALMDWLDSIGIKYDEKNAEETANEDFLTEKLGDDFTGVPVLFVGDEIINGFDRPKTIRALEKVGLK